MAPNASSRLRRSTVAAMALISLAAFWLTFSLRYVWYLDAPTALAMRNGLALAVLGIVLCWFFAPSRLLVGALGLAGMFFPLLVGLTDVPINLGFLPFVALAVGLLVATTHLRRRVR